MFLLFKASKVALWMAVWFGMPALPSPPGTSVPLCPSEQGVRGTGVGARGRLCCLLLVIVVHVCRGNVPLCLWKTLRRFSISNNEMGSYLGSAASVAACKRCGAWWLHACTPTFSDKLAVNLRWTQALASLGPVHLESHSLLWLQCHQPRPCMYKTTELLLGCSHKHAYACISVMEPRWMAVYVLRLLLTASPHPVSWYFACCPWLLRVMQCD